MSLPRTDRLLWSIMLVTATLVALVTWLLLPPETTGGITQQPSTFFNVGYGAKAAYLVLDRLEYPVDRLRRPITDGTLDGIGCLFILKPSNGLQDYELTELEAWVKQGHALVVAPGRSMIKMFAKDDQTATKSERSEFRRQQGTYFEDWFNVDDAAAKPAETPHSVAEAGQPELAAKVDASEPICAGIHHLVAGGDIRFAKSPLAGPLAKMPVKTFWSDELGAIGVRVQFGDGVIVALADAYPLTNRGINDADNGLLLDNIARELSTKSPGIIAFDEYHHGFAQRDWSALAMAKLMLTGPWRWVAAQSLLVGILALYLGAVRFGSPRDIVRKPRRQQREFAEAAGRLLNEAGATSLAVETLGRHYRDRICRSLHLEPKTDDARLSQAVRERAGSEVADLFDRAQIAMSKAVGRQELLTIAQKLHRVTETLDHGY